MSSKIKLHLSTAEGGPLCGRFLNGRHPTEQHHIRDASQMLTTQDISQVKCRHCLRKAGVIPPIPKGGFLAEKFISQEDGGE